MKYRGYEIVIPPLWAAKTTVYTITNSRMSESTAGLPTGPCSCSLPTLACPCSHKWLPHLPRCRDYQRQSQWQCHKPVRVRFLPFLLMFHHKTTGQVTGQRISFIITPSLAPSRHSSTKAPQMASTHPCCESSPAN